MKKVQNDPVSVKMLRVSGDDLMRLLAIGPGPKIGALLEVLLSEVIEDPGLNTKEYLEKRAKELDKYDLTELRKRARDTIEEKQKEEDRKMRRQFKVK